MPMITRVILSLLLIAAAALATAAMRDAGWLALGGPLGGWATQDAPTADPAQIGLTEAETLRIGRMLDAIAGD